MASQQRHDLANLTLASEKQITLNRQVVATLIKREERGKVEGEIGTNELEDALGSPQVFEAMLAEVAQGHIRQELILHQVSGCL